MSVDYNEILWKALNEKYGNGETSTFVMTSGLQLNASDYSIAAGNRDRADYNTFILVDEALEIAPTYQPKQSHVSNLWNNLLEAGRGPEAGSNELARFEQAKKALYTVYDTQRSPFYQEYFRKLREFDDAALDLKEKMQEKHGDNWVAPYEERLSTLPHYYELKADKPKIKMYENDIDDWNYGQYAATIKSMKKTYEDSQISAVINGRKTEFLLIQMMPSNWYQWFDQQQPLDGEWTEIVVTENSKYDQQSNNYRKVGGSGSMKSFFLTVKAKGSGEEILKETSAGSTDIEISFKVRAVQISRRWLDLAALKLEKYTIPGLRTGDWSTGELSTSNKGSFPLLSTQMIVAKDVKVTASKFSESVSEALKSFNIQTRVATLFGLFQLGGSSYSSTERNYTFEQSSSGSSITVHTTEVVGFGCTVLPRFPR